MHRSLYQSALFSGVAKKEAEELLSGDGISLQTYPKGEIIALQGTGYTTLLCVGEGTVAAEKVDRFHRRLSLERLRAQSLVAPFLLFSENNKLPVNLTALTGVTIVSITREKLLRIFSVSPTVLENFLRIVSSNNKFLSDSTVYFAYKTIKGKFANYLLDKLEATGGNTFRNDLTQREMAELFGVTRPALARAIGEMAQEETIYVKGKEITVLFTEKLLQYAKY